MSGLWSNDQADPDRYRLIGHVDRSTGLAELRFWQAMLARGFLVEGTFHQDGSFTGTATDPIPGCDGYPSSGGFDYNVTGDKT